MKRCTIVAAALTALLVLIGCSGGFSRQQADASDHGVSAYRQEADHEAELESAGNHKILVAYFSHSGNTRSIAAQIHDLVGGDLFEIKTVKKYNTDFETTVAEAMEEKSSNARPALAAKVDGIQGYDVVFLGFPNWCGTMPMALFSFLEQYDFGGKTIVPFCTHGSSGLSSTIEDLKKLAPQANVREALGVHRSDVRASDGTVKAWLGKLGYLQSIFAETGKDEKS